MSTATQKETGFGPLYCPSCHEAGATISLDLYELAGFECKDCGETFSRQEIEERIEELKVRLERWAKVLAWLDAAPAID